MGAGDVDDADGMSGRARRLVGRAWRWVALSGDRRVVAASVRALGFLANGPLGHAVLTPVNPRAQSDSVTVPLVAVVSRHRQAAGQFVAGEHGGDVDLIESD